MLRDVARAEQKEKTGRREGHQRLSDAFHAQRGMPYSDDERGWRKRGFYVNKHACIYDGSERLLFNLSYVCGGNSRRSFTHLALCERPLILGVTLPE
jgi:hypothetical protein